MSQSRAWGGLIESDPQQSDRARRRHHWPFLTESESVAMDSLNIHVYGRISRDEKLALERELQKVGQSGAPPFLNSSSPLLTFHGEYPQSVDERSRRSCTARIFMISGAAELRRSAVLSEPAE